MWPAYPFICMNAAITLYLARGWTETAFIKVTRSPYRASKTRVFSVLTLLVLLVSVALSASRILALNFNYHAPFSVVHHFEYKELPRVLRETGLYVSNAKNITTAQTKHSRHPQEEWVDLSPVKRLGLTLCIGKEWYRFPSHYLIPDGVRVEFIRSEFGGQLPRHFDQLPWHGGQNLTKAVDLDAMMSLLTVTRRVPRELNDANHEEPGRYVDVSTCDYLIDVDFPKRYAAGAKVSALEPRYAVDSGTWDRAFCGPFLDAERSSRWGRMLYVPPSMAEKLNEYGDYCLLRHKRRAADRERRRVW